MNEPLHLSGSPLINPDRINDLYSTACEVHAVARRDEPGRQGFVARTRGSVGRRLISLGTTVAGHAA